MNNFMAFKLDNSEEMYRFLGIHKLPKLTQEETENQTELYNH